MLFGALQDVIHLIDVVCIQADVAVKGQAFIGLVGSVVAVGKTQVDDTFWTCTTAEKAIRKRIPGEHIEVLIEVDRDHVAGDVHVLAFSSEDLFAKYRLPIIAVQLFEVDVFEVYIGQFCPCQFSMVSWR